MKVTNATVSKIDTKCINRLAYELNVCTKTIERRIEKNKDNGPLTASLAVNIISEETGVSKNKVLTDK